MYRFIAFLSVLFLFLSAQAKIWRVNNNPGIAANFTTVDAAVNHASVVSGDTIHVEPSATQYGDVYLSKSLVFIGNGYFLNGSGANTGLQFQTNESKISYVYFQPGSEGSKFYGLYFVSPYSYAFGFVTTLTNQNILFEKCYIYNPYLFAGPTTYRNVTFRKCYLVTIGIFQGNANVLENVTFENNLIHGYNGSFNVIANNIEASNNILIRNNTFHTGGTLNATKAYVANNLINSGGCVFTNCVVENNIFSAAQAGVTVGPLSANGNNLVSQPWAALFIASGSEDGQYQLAPGSAAIGGGVKIGSYKPDCGAFGSTDPYKLSGIPPVPAIYGLNLNTSAVPAGSTGTMQATISTRGNN